MRNLPAGTPECERCMGNQASPWKTLDHGPKLHTSPVDFLALPGQKQAAKPKKFWITLFACIHLRSLLGQDPHPAGIRINHSHVVPIVGKLFATAEADKISSRDGRDSRTRLAFTAGYEWRAFLMATAENFGPGHLNQFNKHRHLTNGGPSEVERTKPQNARLEIGNSLDLHHVPYFLGSH